VLIVDGREFHHAGDSTSIARGVSLAFKCPVLRPDWKEVNSTFVKFAIGKERRILPGIYQQEGIQNVVKKEYMDWNNRYS
jgi:hypothetical protein